MSRRARLLFGLACALLAGCQSPPVEPSAFPPGHVGTTTRRFTPPHLTVRRLPPLELDNWDTIQRAFVDAQVCTLRQGWRGHPSSNFRPTSVRAGWTDDALVVLAELNDTDIFNSATNLNEASFLVGDVFEMFLRPADQDAYYEIHVTPQNQKLQIRFPSAAALRSLRPGDGAIFESWKFAKPVIESRVWVDAKNQQWFAVAVIPFSLVAETSKVRAGTRWLFSFSRYDYTRGLDGPTLSSSSPHPSLGFHRQAEWGTLQFAD